MSLNKNLLTISSFAPEARALRKHFESRFANPLTVRPDRFVWDYWNVPDQYLSLRTPAYEYFPNKLYRQFHERLVLWGRRTLGCHDVSPPWLSLYINGCHQNWHADVPHGPWAFVYSLTPWQSRKFTGGETLMLKPSTLTFWESFEPGTALEQNQIMTKVPARFNQLTVFDPRVPHGVARVDGTMNPLEGRLVIHGWFMNPRPYIEGPLSTTELQKKMKEGWLDQISERVEGHALHGLITLRLRVQASGKVSNCVPLTCTLKPVGPSDSFYNPFAEPFSIRSLIKQMTAEALQWQFKKHKSSSEITLPLLFSP